MEHRLANLVRAATAPRSEPAFEALSQVLQLSARPRTRLSRSMIHPINLSSPLRHGDRARRGGSVIVEQALAHSERQRDARVGDLFTCARHPGPPEHRLLNGCWFNRVEGKPVAIAYATKASCGCRIVTGSTVYRCCKHLDAKAKRLAEREDATP